VKPFVVQHHTIELKTRGKGTVEITEQVEQFLDSSGLKEGLLTVYVRHTSCSLVIMENADPSARTDLHEFFERLVPENTPWFQHTCEGPDDMPSHIRMAPNGIPLEYEVGGASRGRLYSEAFDPSRFTRGERAVATKGEGFVDGTVQIGYFDFALMAVAEKERLAVEAKKTDASGL
jgi:secondary thiamine-phosphate synthase enzyme